MATENELPFIEWLEQEMETRRKSMQEFAEFLGVVPSTVYRALDRKSPRRPTIDFLKILAERCHVSVTTLVLLAYPEAQEIPVSASTQLIAEQLERLPEPYRQAARVVIREFAQSAELDEQEKTPDTGKDRGV